MIAKSLRDHRRALIWWTVGISAFMALYISIFRSVSQDPRTFNQQALAKYPGPLRDLMGGMPDLALGVNFLQTIVYQLFVPMLFVVLATMLANRAIAQPEEAGTLELVVTLPVDRRRLVLQRFCALALALLAVFAVTLAVAWAAGDAARLGVPFDRVLAAHVGVLLLALFFGTVALTVGAVTGRRMIASSVVGVWVAAGYIVVTLGRGVAAIAWLKWLSPFHYYAEGRPLYEGLPVGHYLVLAGATAVLALTAILSFDRRDVGV
ncbi:MULTISPECIES: ABC transporter permease subunit [unclassified Nonomuraea]|uniref:ABC transporter permease subunit n=1 Tax=unclassified Nonomuraea TaxID=2593643 RepID=UPI0033F6D321